MGAHAGTEHRVPAPESLLPERLSPCECPVFDHPFVAAPNVVDENLDLARLPSYTFERSRHLRIHSVVASKTRNPLFVGSTIVYRPAGHEHPRPKLSENACDPAANAEGSTGDDSDFAVQISHWLSSHVVH